MGRVRAVGVGIEMVKSSVIVEGHIDPVLIGKLPIVFAGCLDCCEAAELQFALLKISQSVMAVFV